MLLSGSHRKKDMKNGRISRVLRGMCSHKAKEHPADFYLNMTAISIEIDSQTCETQQYLRINSTFAD